MQVLLSAQFEIIASLDDILSMSEQEAIQHAKTTLRKLLQICSTAASHVVKPDGSLAVSEIYPPTKRGTPKRKKQTSFLDSNARSAPPSAALAVAPQVCASPMKSSPRRKKPIMGKKGVSFSPKKRSPSKRGVRWRDDTDSGVLADFEKTPQKLATSPEASEDSITLPTIPALPHYLASSDVWNDSADSSPIPNAPEPSVELKPKTNRFLAGFLSKKSDGSPPPPTITPLNTSDTEPSPLRSIGAGNATNRSPLPSVPVQRSQQENIRTDSGNNSSSDGENSFIGRSESVKISQALKRAGSVSRASHVHSISDSTARIQRRRSPTAATMAGSPPSENMFTASHARRMVSSQKEPNFSSSVLSPRSAPIMKNGAARRTTIGEGRQVSGMVTAPLRLTGTLGSAPRVRESIIGAVGKGGWR